MSGARLYAPLLGDSAERLAEFIVGSFAFTTPVPYQIDIGVDSYCVLHDPDVFQKEMVKAGLSFTLQVKSNRRPIKYLTRHAIEWVTNLDNPLFVCIVDRRKLRCQIYSTWNMQNALLLYGPMKTVLRVGRPSDGYQPPTVDGDTMYVPLGGPVLDLTPDMVVERDQANHWGQVMRSWIKIDKENLTNRAVGLYWVSGPDQWVANQQPPRAVLRSAFYRNQKNLHTCLQTFTRSAVALRRVIDLLEDDPRLQIDQYATDQLDRTLDAFAGYIMDPRVSSVQEDGKAERALRSAKKVKSP